MTQELTIRLGDINTDDYDHFARLLNAVQREIVDGDTLRNWDRNNKAEEDIHFRYAACLDETIVGYGTLFLMATAQKPSFIIWLTIAEEYRQHGYGAKFYDFLAEQAIEHGATEFSSKCQDDDEVSLSFAEKRGFSIRRHIYESILDLDTFDPTQWSSLIDEVKAQGIRFSSLTQEGNTDEALYKLFELNATTAGDNPTSDGTYKQTFENFKSKIASAYWFRPDGQLLAIDGEQYVGLGAIGFEDDGITTRNAFTGVDRDYRGRKIAQALKVIGAKFAQEQGAKRLVTTNDSLNEPMLAVNGKLGYQRTKGIYLLLKDDV